MRATMPDQPFDNESTFPTAGDLRQQVADVLTERMEVIINDSVAIFPFSGNQPLEADYCGQLGLLLLQLVATCVREGRIDSRTGLVVDLHRLVSERALPVDRLFAFAYLTERTALDELALDGSVGATTEPWPLAAQLIRRASFDVLAAYTERLQQEPSALAITDRLTTLHTRAVLIAALEKELQRAERFSTELAFIVFDVDHLSQINRQYGYGVGDRVLERMGILVRKYFRLHDWVARHSEDSIAVLLARTSAEDALELAERVRNMVEERLAFRDHRTEKRVRVTVSAAVVTVNGVPGEIVEVERVTLDADAAIERAKNSGRNRVEHTIIAPTSMTIPQAAQFLDVSPAIVRKLIAEGALHTLGLGKNVRLARVMLEEYKLKKEI